MMRYASIPPIAALFLVGFVSGCAPRFGRPGALLERRGDEIVVCGQFIHSGAPVVLWIDPGGYDAYRAERHFEPDQLLPSNPVSDSPVRYGSYRRHLPKPVADFVKERGWSLPLLADWVQQFVIHYDVCGTSRRCFQVLQDQRGLSVHFMLDLDGTIYQTLDLKERAWHAGIANDRSVGIEIANIGAYPDMETLDQWYARDADGRMHVTLPASLLPSGIRTPNFVARPARDEVIRGRIQGRDLFQYDLTDEQYESLILLTATLTRVLPRIRLDYPRDRHGELLTTVMDPEALREYSGLLGHWHVSKNKIDPGPAFDWERLLRGVRAVRR